MILSTTLSEIASEPQTGGIDKFGEKGHQSLVLRKGNIDGRIGR